MEKRLLSPSGINTYYQCPRKFYYNYIRKLPTKPSIHLVRGSIAHSVLEDFFDINYSEINELNFEDKLLDKSKDLLKDHWKKKESELSSLNMEEKELQFFFEETEMMIVNWTSIFINRINSKIGEGISFRDAFMSMTPEIEQHYKSEKFSVHGYIDAIYRNDGEETIIDYKTSKKSEITDQYRLQLGIYALMFQEKYRRPPSKVGIFFLKDTDLTFKPDAELITNAIQKIEFVQKMTQSEKIEDYPIRPTRLCNWKNGWSSGQCDFFEECLKTNKNDFQHLL